MKVRCIEKCLSQGVLRREGDEFEYDGTEVNNPCLEVIGDQSKAKPPAANPKTAPVGKK